MENSLLKFYKCIAFITLLTPINNYAQIGDLLWEDNFNSFNTDIWNVDVGNGCEIGLCGWGNAELEYYRNENLSIEPIPGEAGNNALVMEAKRESFGDFEYTSGKVTSERNLSIHYGMIEIRMQTPPLETGLWPAAWLLGTSNVGWPAQGEIDMMEMGHRDEEIANQGHEGTPQDNYVGANAIFANEDGSVGSIAYDVNFNKPYVANTSMANRFMTYRLYWEPTELRLTVIDNGVESDLYEEPLPLSSDSVTSAFQKPFYLLMNLAVGGNFTDAATNNEVTASLPSKLLIDYVKVYEWNGFGEVELDYAQLTAESGPFGVYTENTPVNNELSFGSDSDIFVWGGTMQDGTTEAYEGNEVIAWETLNANGWFGGGIASTFGRNMSGYIDEGTLKFNIKIPADVSFRIGITDNFTNESWLNFNANETTYGLVRNGEWGQVEIPLVDFAGLLAFQNMNYMFAISSIDGDFSPTTFQFAVDDIVWDDGNGLEAPVSITGITSSPAIGTLNIGDTLQLTTEITPTNAPVQDLTWTSTDTNVATVNSNGLITAKSSGSTRIIVATTDNEFTSSSNISVNSITNTTGFTPDPNKTYYIDSPVHNLRLASTGESEEAYTAPVTSTRSDEEWKFVAKGNGSWHIQRAAGGTTPRLRTDNSSSADMQGTAWNGTYTYFDFEKGSIDDTYFITLPDGPANFNRLQIDNSGEVKMVPSSYNGTWESFKFTEVESTTNNTSTVSNDNLFIEAEDFSAMSGVVLENTNDINGGQNVGYIDTNDWMEYVINVPAAGTYTLNTRIASPNSGASANYQINNSVISTIDISSTGGWQVWETVSSTVNLSAGEQTIRLTSTGNNFNFNWFEITESSSSAKNIDSEVSNDNIKIYPVPAQDVLNVIISNFNDYSNIDIVNLNGQVISKKSVTSKNTVINVSSLNNGVYALRCYKNEEVSNVLKFIK